jgi:hypothetical protein
MDERPGTDARGQGIQVGEGNNQYNIWSFHFIPGKHRQRGPRFAVWWIASGSAVAAAAALLLAMHFFAGPLVTARVVGNSFLFSDPKVVNYLASQGVELSQASQNLPSQGSWDICNDAPGSLVKNYDVANMGDTTEAQCLESKLAGYPHSQKLFNVEPLVIVAYESAFKKLEEADVVRDDKEGKGIHVFELAEYLHQVVHPTRLPLPSLAITVPTESNSGTMFVADAYLSLAGAGPITEPFDSSRLDVIKRALFTQETHTPNLMDDFLGGGVPMAVVYENDYLYAAISHKFAPGQVVVMYPTPDINSDDTLVSWSAAGNQLISKVTSPGMKDLAEQDGYRTSEDSADFVSVMHSAGYQVPSLNSPTSDPQFDDQYKPGWQVLQELAREASPG